MSDVTQILSAIESGDPRASEELLPLVYEELRRLARAQLIQEKPGQTLQATALVHEAYLRLVDAPDAGWNSRGHFFAAAAESMRRILVETARRKQRVKHGGEFERVPLDQLDATDSSREDEILAVNEALVRLAEQDDQAARLVKLRYFAGLSLAEAANCLRISPRTADRIWAYAKAWLYRELGS